MKKHIYEYKDIKAEYNLWGDDGDPWGSAMEMWFAVAGELNERNPELIPTKWQYNPGLGGGKDHDSMWTELLEETKTNALVKMGNVMFRYVHILEHKGYGY